jgi:small subunit ribosomal protein S20
VIQGEERRLRNRARKTRMKSAIKELYDAMASGAAETVGAKLLEAVSIIDKTASKGVIHKNKAARLISRLTKKANASPAA